MFYLDTIRLIIELCPFIQHFRDNLLDDCTSIESIMYCYLKLINFFVYHLR